ncbi:DUF6159 family protein [uncultured Methanoregula sp.]|uniref:DUF6159 family protein n=1 Tax=uncultured Methanoregula sp. TaxID=1005933 RepID=UPI002AAB3055|nr:DUF6159 family protein [uncultured Methanoregula sp.]
MFESIGRSISLVKTSWGILMQDKKLLAFPVMSGIISLIVLATFLLPLFFAGSLKAAVPGGSLVFYVGLFVFYLVSYFVVIFFNTALITCVNARLNGREMGIGEALSASLRHLPAILAWALVSATVGLLLQVLAEKAGFIGEIAAGLIGGAWGLVTFFVVPVLMLEEKGVVDSMKESISLIKKTWGESIVGAGSIMLIFMFIGIIAFLGLLGTMFLQNAVVFWIAIFLFIILVIVLGVVASAMQGIFVTALYQYAKTGTVPSAFDKDQIASAFVAKPASKVGNI